ncbi:ThiF family adenylyltransferase [Streptomyces sp. NPDC026673]|uniref:HesA/MoeB/ThiF family protein n=1 Tax=Streptomyces sp. NPDC026673 TaxID=3155724 RepID=UPI0033C11DE8
MTGIHTTAPVPVGAATAATGTDGAPDAFYAAFTERNRGLIPDAAQRALRTAVVLVAGCGSTGGAAVDPLTRLGVQHFVLAEPGAYELNNLNRQHAAHADIGRNKAEVAAERVRAVNPHAVAEVRPEGIRPENVAALLGGCDIVVDGVDVTTPEGWHAKYALHAEAAAQGRPVVSGYDMSGTQYIRYYDYRLGLPPLAGEVTAEQVAAESVWELLLRIVPRELVPEDLLADVRAHRDEPDYSVPQLVYTSLLFGVLTARYVVEVLAGRPVREALSLDVHQIVRPQS